MGFDRSVNRIAIQAENIVMLSTLLAEHQKIRDSSRPYTDPPGVNLSKSARQEENRLNQKKKEALLRTEGAINALQAAIFTMYEGIGEDLKILCREAK